LARLTVGLQFECKREAMGAHRFRNRANSVDDAPRSMAGINKLDAGEMDA
jgi:hypothetical protein